MSLFCTAPLGQTRRVCWCGRFAAICAAITFCGTAQRAAGDVNHALEIDGNVIDGAGSAAPDWCSLVNGAVSVDVQPVVISDAPQATIFTQGGSKDTLDIPNWRHTDGNVPAKDDIKNAAATLLAHPVVAGDSQSGHRIVGFFGDRFANNGDAQIGFWAFQDTVGPLADGTFSGHHINGDLLVLAHFVTGGAAVELQVFEWQAGANNDNLVDVTGIASGRAQTNASLLSGSNVCFGAYPPAGPAGDWNFTPKQGSPNTYPAMEFFEGAVDLSALFDPNGTGCLPCFHSFLVETRSSQSLDAVLKDFVLGDFNTCGNLTGRKLEVADDDTCNTVLNPLANWEIRLYDVTNPATPVLVTQDGNCLPLTNPVCTAADGSYAFNNLRLGQNYRVCEVIPNPLPTQNFIWRPCAPADGANGLNINSAACAGQNPSGGHEFCHAPFVLQGNAVRDFRNFKQPTFCTLSGIAFCDINGNGVQNLPADNQGLGGFCIRITSSDGGKIMLPNGTLVSTATQVTDSAGAYAFVVETGHSYTREEIINGSACGSTNQSTNGWILTTGPQTVTVPPLATDADCQLLNRNFGNASIPTVSCGSGNVTRSTDPGVCTAHFCFTPTASNLCGPVSITCVATGPGGVNVPLTSASGGSGVQRCGDFPGPGATNCGNATSTVTCTATTGAGLTATCTFNVTVTDNEPPVITNCTATGGNLGATCSTPITFSADVTDNCCVDANDPSDILCEATVLSGTASIGTVTCNRTQTAPNQVHVSASFTLSNPGNCPRVRVRITARDCCGNQALTPCERTLRTNCQIVVDP